PQGQPREERVRSSGANHKAGSKGWWPAGPGAAHLAGRVAAPPGLWGAMLATVRDSLRAPGGGTTVRTAWCKNQVREVQMPQRKAEQLRVAERRAEVLRLHRLGLKQSEIVTRLGLAGAAGAMTVSRDLAAVQAQWKASAVRDYDTEKGRLLCELGAVRR